MKVKRLISILLLLAVVGTFASCRKNPNRIYEYISDDTPGMYVDGNNNGGNTGSQDGSNASNGSNANSGNKNNGTNNSGTANGTNGDNTASGSSTQTGGNTAGGGTNNGGTANNAGTTNNGGGTNTNTNTNSGTTNLEGNTYLSGFPIVKNKESIKIMAVTRASDIGDTNKSQFTKTYSKMTNMDIKFDLVTDEAMAQRKTLALQSGNLPDIFAGCKITDQDVQQYSSEGVFVEITKEMLQKYAPNIVKFYDDYDMWDLVKATDGKMYSIANGTQDFNYDQHYLWINKTWLKKLGLSMPKTMNDFYNVLKAFKTKDPNGNGQSDEIPYATWSSGGFFTHPWGVSSGIFVAPNGKVTYGGATDNLKKCATFWNKVYKENLVDKNTIDNWAGDNAAFKTLIGSGKVGAFFWGWPDTMSDSLVKQYEICPWPTSGESNGDYYPVYTTVMNNFLPNGFFITKSCKNVPAALRFLDYLYTNDGYMLTCNGNPGYLYTKVNDTTYKSTGKVASASDLLGPKWTLRGRYFLVGATYEQKDTHISQQRKAADKEMASRVKKYNQKTMSVAFKNKTEVKSINQYSTYFDSMNSTYIQYVKGDKNLTSDWTAMVNELNKKGLSKYLSAWQTYYDRVSK